MSYVELKESTLHKDKKGGIGSFILHKVVLRSVFACIMPINIYSVGYLIADLCGVVGKLEYFDYIPTKSNIRLSIKSNTVMARPLVFSFNEESNDVFHG